MRIFFLELRDRRLGLASQKFNSLMLPILAVWSERLGWKARVSFTEFDAVEYDVNCDVAAISTYTYLAPQSRIVAQKFREMGKIVVMGGAHARCYPDEMLEFADVVFERCCEESWCEFLRRVENGSIVANTRPGIHFPSAELTRIPPLREVAKFYGRGKIPLVLSSFGCPNNCDFCVEWNSGYYKREIDDVLQDIQSLRAKFFIFNDANFGANRKSTTELLLKMRPLKKRYFMETSLNHLLDEEYLGLLRDSGNVGIEIGIESLSRTYRKNKTGEAKSLLEDVIQKIEKIKKYIPIIQVNMVLGLDSDTEKTFADVYELYLRSQIDFLVPYIATPFPGTPLWERLKAEGRIFEKLHEHFNTHDLVMTLKNFSTSRFLDLYIDLLRRLYRPRLIIKKTIDNFKKYRSLRYAGGVLLILVGRALNAWRYDIPALLASKKRAAARLAESSCATREKGRKAVRTASAGAAFPARVEYNADDLNPALKTARIT